MRNPTVSAASIEENGEKEGGKRPMVDSKERGDLLIEGPRTSRGPRTPNMLGSHQRRRLLPGVFFPIFTLFFFFFLLGLDPDVMGLGYNTRTRVR